MSVTFNRRPAYDLPNGVKVPGGLPPQEDRPYQSNNPRATGEVTLTLARECLPASPTEISISKDKTNLLSDWVDRLPDADKLDSLYEAYLAKTRLTSNNLDKIIKDLLVIDEETRPKLMYKLAMRALSEDGAELTPGVLGYIGEVVWWTDEDKQSELWRKLVVRALEMDSTELTPGVLGYIGEIAWMIDQDKQSELWRELTKQIERILESTELTPGMVRDIGMVVKRIDKEKRPELQQKLAEQVDRILEGAELTPEMLRHIGMVVEGRHHEFQQRLVEQIDRILEGAELTPEMLRHIGMVVESRHHEFQQRLVEQIDRILESTELTPEMLRNIGKVVNRIDKEKQPELQQKLVKQIEHLTSYLTSSPLHDIASSEIIEFSKTGSNTYVLPSNEDASVRVIATSAARSWLEALGDWSTWYSRGFTYVPIEPIIDLRCSETSPIFTTITTSNLHGRALSDLAVELVFSRHLKELDQMKEAIIDGLTSIGVIHGHLHDDNFVVVPYITDNGTADLSRCPRLYVIDFDMAELAKQRSQSA